MSSTVFEIAYGKHPLQRLKFFRFCPQYRKSLLFIHGGAWRDPTNTFDDFEGLAEKLAGHESCADVNLVGINYRLSPEVKFPEHLLDLVSGVRKIIEYTLTQSLSVLGHSVGATLMLQLLYYKTIFSAKHQSLLISELGDISSVTLDKLYFIDGIYDVVELVKEYGPPYKEFVDCAYASEHQYRETLPTSWRGEERGASFKLTRSTFVLVQSKQDELLSLRQTSLFRSFLDSRGIRYKYYEEDWGSHEEVYTREELVRVVAETLAEPEHQS